MPSTSSGPQLSHPAYVEPKKADSELWHHFKAQVYQGQEKEKGILVGGCLREDV